MDRHQFTHRGNRLLHTKSSFRLALPVAIICSVPLLLPMPTGASDLLSTLIDFGKNMLMTAASNYTSKHGNEMKQLLETLSSPGTPPFQPGMPGGSPNNPYNPNTGYPPGQGGAAEYPHAQGQPYDPNAGYPPPSGQGNPYGNAQGGEYPYDPNTGYPPGQGGGAGYPHAQGQPYDPNTGNPEYGNPADPYGSGQEQNYPYDPNTGYPQGQGGTGAPHVQGQPYDPNTGYTQAQGGTPSYGQPYPSDPNSGYQGGGYPPNPHANTPGQGNPYDPNAGYPPQGGGTPYGTSQAQHYPNDPNATYPSQGNPEPYRTTPEQGYAANPGTGQPYQETTGVPIRLDVALIKKTILNGAEVVVPIQDGDILRDGRGNAQAGDKFRIMFRANTDSYVYVVAIDGSAWAQGVFPSMTSPFANPVKKGHQYVMPEGNNWFSLDQFRGIETIFFVASHHKRPDIEKIVSRIAGQERHPKATPKQVTEPPIIPAGFQGQVASTTPFMLPRNTYQRQSVLPTTFFTKKAGEALRVTRWFRHQ